MPIKKEDAPVVVKLKTIPYNSAMLRIVGDTPLLSDRCPYLKIGESQPKLSEEEKFEQSIYYTKDGRYAFISKSVKAACINAARHIPSLTMVQVRGLFYIDEGEGVFAIEDPKTGNPVEKPVIDRQMVQKKDGKSIPAVRARYDNWAISFEVRWQSTMTNLETIIQILQVAGENVGLGAQRQEKSGRHVYGVFHVETA